MGECQSSAPAAADYGTSSAAQKIEALERALNCLVERVTFLERCVSSIGKLAIRG